MPLKTAGLFLVLTVLLLPLKAAAAETMPVMSHRISEANLDSGIIRGQVFRKDKKPLINGAVLLYAKSLGPPPSADKYLRIPNDMVSTDGEGKFSIKAPEGSYYLSALKWAPKTREVGPPKDGDPLFDLLDDKGQFQEVFVRNGTVVNVGVIGQTAVFNSKDQKFTSGITSVEGIITDLQGKPVEGAIVLGATQNQLSFASYMTGKDGKFQLRTNEGGEYYLTITSRYGGGQPSPGDQLIVPAEESDQKLVVLKKGERTKGIILKAKRLTVPTPNETGTGTLLKDKPMEPLLPIYQKR